MATITRIDRKYGPVFRAAICVKGRRETATFDSKAKAMTWAEETEALLRSGQPLPGELPANDMRFNEAVEKYTMAVAPRKKRNTQRLDQEIGGRLIRYFEGKSLQTITSKDIVALNETQPDTLLTRLVSAFTPGRKDGIYFSSPCQLGRDFTSNCAEFCS